MVFGKRPPHPSLWNPPDLNGVLDKQGELTSRWWPLRERALGCSAVGHSKAQEPLELNLGTPSLNPPPPVAGRKRGDWRPNYFILKASADSVPDVLGWCVSLR